MLPPPTLLELLQLLEITEQCTTEALSAQRRAAKYGSYYRASAKLLRERAARSRLPEIREKLSQIAARHEYAESVIWGDDIAEASSDDAGGTVNAQTVPAEEEKAVRDKPDEDPLAMSRRHVAQAEGHIARQEALILRLSGDERHAALAAEAKEILATLKQTLKLARAHLAIELKK